MMHLPSLLRRSCVVALLGLLSACSILQEAEKLSVYQLPAVPTARAQATPVDWSLRVGKPHSGSVLDSVRILVMRESNEISVYQGVRWSDPAPVLLRNRLVDMFIQDGSIRSLSTDDSNLQADLELSGDLRSFQVEYQNGVPVVMIKLDARLVQTSSRRIVAARTFDVRQTVDGVKVPEVVIAFGKAADTLAVQVRDWTLRQGSASLAASR